jgi:hypothetical protein
MRLLLANVTAKLRAKAVELTFARAQPEDRIRSVSPVGDGSRLAG